MNKALISVLGNDQPGIMAAVATVITEHGGNIENLSQTLLQSVFGALLMVSMSLISRAWLRFSVSLAIANR